MYIKQNRETDNLMKDSKAFLLLLKIAYKTKLDDGFEIPEVEIGQAFIKGCDDVGMTMSEYRTTKNKLQKWGFAKFRTTTKGTIAELTTDKFFELEATK